MGSSWVFAVLPLGAVPFSVSSTPLCTVCAGCDAGLCVVRLLFGGFCPSGCLGLSPHVYPSIIFLALVRPRLAHLCLFSGECGEVSLVA